MPSTTIGEFIEQARNDHVDDLHGVALRLEAAWPLLRREPAGTGDFLALAEHILVDHLGDVDAMARWLDRLAPMALEHPQAAAPLAQARLAVALLRGEPAVASGQAPADVVRAHGSAANGAAARGEVARARELLRAADALVPARAPAASVKALAAVANNLASRLLDGPRGADSDALMVDAAEMAKVRWHQAGTWLEAERAEYLIAVVAAAVGDGAKALRHATACLSLCTAHGADALERCFAHEALARASLAAGDRTGAGDAAARMHAALQEIDDAAERALAASAWGKLQPSLGRA